MKLNKEQIRDWAIQLYVNKNLTPIEAVIEALELYLVKNEISLEELKKRLNDEGGTASRRR
jgi:predicted transcriptional regulator